MLACFNTNRRPAQNQTEFSSAGLKTIPLIVYYLEGFVEVGERKSVFLSEQFACAARLSFQVDAEHKDSLALLGMQKRTQHNISEMSNSSPKEKTRV